MRNINVRIAHRLLSALITCAAMYAASEARAAVSFFTSRLDWQAAAGAPTFSEDFSRFAVDTSFATSPVALADMTISREGPEAGLSNFIDVPPLVFAGGSGTPQAELYVNTNEGSLIGTQVRLTFDLPNLAFGFDSWEAVGLEGSVLEIFSGATLLGSQPLGGGAGAFLGYVLTGGDTATSIRFRANLLIVGTSGEGFAIDNLAGVSVPEPATCSFGTIALATLAARRRRLQD